MRRNARGGHRGGRGGPSFRPTAVPQPLMADRFGLHDIDKELELLQRKREIIEQQQQILSNEFRGINNYGESYSQSSRFDDYAYPSISDRRDYNPPNRKRPIPVWEGDLTNKVWDGALPNKRFSGAARPRTRNPGPAAPPPLMTGPFFSGTFQNPRHSVRPQTSSFKPKPFKKETTAKVTKPAASAPPNKLNTYSVAERKKLITKAINQTSERSDANRLLPDREPSKQVKGRLELALGVIIKDIKAGADPSVGKSSSVMRDIKTIVRDRLREMMMNEIVECSDTVIRRYREVYNKQSDKEIVDYALEAHTGDVTLINIDDPEKYFKINMHKIMHMKLKRLLDKLEQVSRAECKSAVPPEKMMDDLLEAERTPLDKKMTSTEKFKVLEKWMTIKMTVLIKKSLPYIMKIMDIDTKYSRLKDMITSETVKMLVQKDDKEGIKIDVSDVSMTSLNATLNQSKQNKSPNKALPYFAKLMGKPGLPKRNQMEQFFKQFEPKSIKKHRTVHNLLFVGFLEKENFEKFLTFDGTKMGKHVLSIRVSERAQVKKEPDVPDHSDEKLIGDELDEQITDLLTSIKNAEGLEEDGNNVDSAGTNEGDNADNTSDVKDNAGDAEDIADNANENVEGNVAESAEEDIAENADENITENADENIAENVDENIAENADENVPENADEKITENADANGKTVEPKSDEKNVHTGEEKAPKDGLEAESTDKVQPLDVKPIGRSTPVRSSTRLAGTPGRIQTRRASRLAQNE